MTIRVLVVDDSALLRSLLTEVINRTGDLRVVATAADPLVARELIRELSPDVVTLDVEMPRMNGLDFLERLMRLRPTPVVMVSTLTERGAQATLRALELGAVDFVAKPNLAGGGSLEVVAAEICAKIRLAAGARVWRRSQPPPQQQQAGVPAVRAQRPTRAAHRLLAIGSSTGGTEALRQVLVPLPEDFPGIVITQHMPPGFTASFAARLDGLCQVRVKEAADGDLILHGHAYLAPGGRHLLVQRQVAGFVARVRDGEPVERHRPSVDVLFRSVAECVGSQALGLMLTGMGADGAQAMREMRDRGAYNLVQDEASCVVFGMPRAAIAAGAAHEVLPLAGIAQRLKELAIARPAELKRS